MACAVAKASPPSFTGNINAQWIAPLAVPTPNSGSTIIGFGDSTTYGAYGPTACVAAANQPSSVAPASLTGTCWLDRIGSFYGAHVIDLAVGGSTLRNDGTNNAASGITRYNTSYTCPTQSASPTSGLGTNCKSSAVLPALDTLVGPNTFVYIAYNGINDSSNAPNVVDYSGALTDYNTIVTDLEAHGQPANQIVFVGAPKGAAGNGYYTQYIGYTAAMAQAAVSCGCSFVGLWNGVATNANYSTNFYDTIHPNDAGSAVWATAIEGVNGLGAALNYAAYQLVGALYVNNGVPKFDTSGNLTLPSGATVSVSSWYAVNHQNAFGGDGANTIIKACCAGNTIYFQTQGGTNIAHFTANSLVIDAGGGGITTPGVTDSGGLNMTGSTPAYITFAAKNEFGYDGSNTLIRACCAGNTTYFQDASGNNVAHFTATALVIDSTGGIQPHGTSGGFVAESLPNGNFTTHPVHLTGTCAVTSPSTACTFPGGVTFTSTSYLCTVSAEGTSPLSDSWVNTSISQITIYSGTSATFSYACDL